MSLMGAGGEGGGERVVEGHEERYALVVALLDELLGTCSLLRLHARVSIGKALLHGG